MSEPKKLKLGKGVETLYRNAYRMQLELTNLADGKANMMISINSLSFTILVVAGGVVAGTQPWLLLPISVFLLSSLGAMLFAVLATRPRLSGRAPTSEQMRSGEADLLFFENFKLVSSEEYVESLSELAYDPERVYEQMARTIHALGTTLSTKFHLLRSAYTVFISGLVVSLVLFFVVFAVSAGDAEGAGILQGVITYP